MRERYPYLRLITDAGNIVAGLVAVLVFVAGSASGCRMGGVAGFASFVVTGGLAWVVYMAVMAQIEAHRVMLQIESDLRDLLAQSRQTTPNHDAGV